MTGFDHKRLELSNNGTQPVEFILRADVTREGKWIAVQEFTLHPGETLRHEFPSFFQAYWVRLIAKQDTTGTAQLIYD